MFIFVLLMGIINKPIYNRNRKEFYLSQSEDDSLWDTDLRSIWVVFIGLWDAEA